VSVGRESVVRIASDSAGPVIAGAGAPSSLNASVAGQRSYCASRGFPAQVTLAILTTDYGARPADALWLTSAHLNAES
jgi:hypothetical protein